MSTDPASLVAEFCQAFARRDIDELLGYFTDDAVYHNMPMAPAVGHGAIREVLGFFVPMAQAIEFEVRHLVAAGPVVLTERVDVFQMGDKEVRLPVAGVFEVRDGKIAAWRDYFDMPTFTSQLAG